MKGHKEHFLTVEKSESKLIWLFKKKSRYNLHAVIGIDVKVYEF